MGPRFLRSHTNDWLNLFYVLLGGGGGGVGFSGTEYPSLLPGPGSGLGGVGLGGVGRGSGGLLIGSCAIINPTCNLFLKNYWFLYLIA